MYTIVLSFIMSMLSIIGVGLLKNDVPNNKVYASMNLQQMDSLFAKSSNVSSDFLYHYAYALKHNDRIYTHVVDKYIKKKKLFKAKTHTEKDALFIHDFANNLFSKALDVMLVHKQAYAHTHKFGTYYLNKKIAYDLVYSARWAAQYNSPVLFKRCLKLISKANLGNESAILFEVKTAYYQQCEDWQAYSQAIVDFTESQAQLSPIDLYENAKQLINKSTNKQHLWYAQSWLRTSVHKMPTYQSLYAYAYVLLQLNQYQQARTYTYQAIEAAKSTDMPYTAAETLLHQINGVTLSPAVLVKL